MTELDSNEKMPSSVIQHMNYKLDSPAGPSFLEVGYMDALKSAKGYEMKVMAAPAPGSSFTPEEAMGAPPASMMGATAPEFSFAPEAAMGAPPPEFSFAPEAAMGAPPASMMGVTAPEFSFTPQAPGFSSAPESVPEFYFAPASASPMSVTMGAPM